jgi:hypothetical protein
VRPEGKRSLEHSLAWAGALIGLLLGAITSRLVPVAVSPDQPIGFARLHGLNPQSELVRFFLIALATVAGAWVGRSLARPPATFVRATLSKLRDLTLWQRLVLSVFLSAAILAAFYRLPVRWQTAADWAGWLALVAVLPWAKPAASTTRIGLAIAVAHAITVWLFVAAAGARAGISLPSLVALLLAISIFEGRWLGQGDLERGAPSLALAALTFPVAFWSHRTEKACFLAALAAVVLPLLGPLAKAWFPRSKRSLRALAVVGFLPGSIVALGAAASLHAPLQGSLFEDGHGLLPASEYLRGEMPYRDIVPAHGLMSDGLIQTVELAAFGDDYRGISRGSKVVGAFFWPAFYAVGAAATGSPAVGFWSMCLSFLVFPQFQFFRVMASLGCLALVGRALRTARAKAWFLAGAALPVAFFFAVDFAVYAGAATVAAVVVSRGKRAANLKRLLAGAAAAGLGVAALFAALGILRAFLHDTFVLIPRLLPAYALGAPAPPGNLVGGLSGIGLVGSLLDSNALYYWFLPAALLVTAVLVARAPAVGARGRALFPLLVWFWAATPSVIERQHIGYPLFVAPAAGVLLARWIKGHRPWRSLRGGLAAATLSVLLLASRPLDLLPAVVSGLATSAPPAGSVALEEPPRVRGSVFSREEALAISATGSFLKSGALAPGDTWLDFANVPLLYYLFDRDCPIRYYEVPLYQRPSEQEEVITAIDRNQRVKAVLMRTGRSSDAIDGIPNHQRAPRVFQYLRGHFRPAFSKDGVEFWLRNPAGKD